MIRRPAAAAALIALVLLAAPAASAQTPDEVAAVVRDRGYWIDPGLPAPESRVSAAVAAAGNAGLRLFVVLLEQDPPGGPTTFADAVLDRLGDGTVLVLSENGEAMASFVLSEERMDAALEAGYAAGGGDAGYVEAVVRSLTGAPVEPGGNGGEGAGGGTSTTGLIVLLVLVGGLVALVVWAVRRQGKAARASRQRALEEARREIKAQLDAMANTILAISDQVSLSDSREDNQYLEQAGKTYTEASESYEAAADLAQLEQISDRLDEARWQLEAAAALAEGRPVPEKPAPTERSACFFDPTHRGPFEDAQVRTAAGTRTVRVCAADAEKLRRGEAPETRMISVGGREVPAAAAPRSYGGGGLDWLDVFAVIVGGMAAGRSFDWGRSRGSGGWGSGTGGWGRTGGRSVSRSSGSWGRVGRSGGGGSATRSRVGHSRPRSR